MIKNKLLRKFRPYKIIYKKTRDILPGDIVKLCKNELSVACSFEIEKIKINGELVELHFKDRQFNCQVLLWGCNIYEVKTLHY